MSVVAVSAVPMTTVPKPSDEGLRLIWGSATAVFGNQIMRTIRAVKRLSKNKVLFIGVSRLTRWWTLFNDDSTETIHVQFHYERNR